MAKSKIIKELVNEKIGLSTALYRLLLIANDIEDNELITWVENELNGYSEGSLLLPSYRVIKSTYLTYSGINGSFQVTNLPLPINYISDEYRDGCKKIHIKDSIESVERIIKNDSKIIRDLTLLAPDVLENSGLQCSSIRLNCSENAVVNILSTVKTRIVKVLLMLEKKFGNLDDLDISEGQLESVNIEDIYKEINVIINDNSVKIGDKNSIDESMFKIGEIDGY